MLREVALATARASLITFKRTGEGPHCLVGIASLQSGPTGSRYRTNARVRLPGQMGVRTLPCARSLAATECVETLAPRAPLV